MKRKNLKKPMISALEQRILFDGAAVATAVDVLDNSSFSTTSSSDSTSKNDVTNNNAENSVHEAQAVQGFEKDRKEVAFVDITVKDYQTLVDGIGAGVETYLVSSFDEINSILQNQKDIDAIHILSHGSTGEITVGNDVLNNGTLDKNAQLLETIKNSLSESGDILLYGCNVASDGNGEGFINSIAQITQADVAASDDLTGSSALGGDWDLEKSSGIIDVENIFIDNYTDVLSTPTSGETNFSSYASSQGGYNQITAGTDNVSTLGTTDLLGWSITGHISSGYAGNASDAILATESSGIMYFATNSGATQYDYISFKSNDGKIFDLGNISVDYGGHLGDTTPINITVAGYLNGNLVSNAVLTKSLTGDSLAGTYTLFDITNSGSTTSNAFIGVDEIRVISGTTSSSISSDGFAFSQITATNFRTVDITAPTFDVTPATSSVTATTVDLSASLDEAGKIYYVVVADGATAPSIAQIKAGQDSSGASALKSGNSDVTTTPFTGTYNITGLSANTAYDIYVVGQDDEGTPNVMATATKVDVRTENPTSEIFNFETTTGLISGSQSNTFYQVSDSLSTYFSETVRLKIVSDNTIWTNTDLLSPPSAGAISDDVTVWDDGNTATIWTFSIDGGYTFDLTSLLIHNDLSDGDVITITSNKGGVITKTLGSMLTTTGEIFSASEADFPSKFIDISSFTITSSAGSTFGTGFMVAVDEISVENVTAPALGPIVSAGTGNYTDTNANDTGFTNTTGTISATASSGSITGYGINTGTTGGTDNIGGTVYDVSKTGTYGTLYVKSSDGSYVYVPTSDSVINATSTTVTDTFTIQATDSNGTGNGTLTITINGVNDTPELTAPTSAGYTDTSATDTFSNTTGTLSASDRDSGTILTYGINIGTGGSTLISGVTYDVSKAGTYGTLYVKSSDGSYVYVPTASAINALTSNATDIFTVSASDTSASDTQTLTINITGVNDIPTAQDKTITINEDTQTLLSVSDFGFADADTNDALVSLKITSLASDGTLEYYNGTSWVAVTLNQIITVADITGNKLRFNPSLNENGTTYATFNFTVNDGKDESSAKIITYNVTAVNDAPTVANAIVDQNASVSNAFSFTVPLNSFSDVDSTDTLTYTAQLVDNTGTLISGGTLPSWLSFNSGTKTFSGTPAIGDAGTIYIKVIATDNGTGNLSVSDIFTITTNAGPAAPSAPNLTPATDSGSSQTDDITNDNTPTFLGNGAVSGATITLYDTDGTTVLGTTTANGAGNWMLTSSTLSDGAHTITAKQTVSGQESSASSSLSVTIDTSTPSASVTTATLKNSTNATVQSSETGTAYIIKDTVSVSTLSDITDASDDNFNSATISSANTNTNIALSGLVDGTYKVYSVDTAGNLSLASTNTITIDTTAPTSISVSTDSISSSITGINSNIATISATDVHTITYALATGNGTNDADNSNFNISGMNLKTSSVLSAGTYNIYLSATDSAGNVTYQAVTITVNSGPTVSTAVGTYTDTSANDTFNNTTGIISATASSGSITGYGINTGTTGGTDNIGGTVYDVSKTGTYGTLYVKSSDGSYVYVPTSDSVINATSTTVTDTFTIEATDSAGTKGNTLTITINGLNDTPTVANIIGNQTATQDSVYNFQFPSNVFSDVDSGDIQTYTAQLVDSNGNLINGGILPTWLTFTSGTRTFSGTPANADVGILNVKVTAIDGSNAMASNTFSLTIANVNDAPSGSVIISGIVKQGETLTASNTIADADGLGTITYQWYADNVLITGATNSTYILTQNEVDKIITVKASYTDGQNTNETVISSATTSIVNVNDAPTVSSENIDVTVPFGNDYVKNISTLFNDIDNSDTLIFEAINLPSGLSINPLTGVISGKPTQSGNFVITIKGTDSGSPALSVSRTYTMLVLAPAQMTVDTPTVNTPTESNTIPTEKNTNISLNTFTDNTNFGIFNYGTNGNNNVENIVEGFISNKNPQDNPPQNTTETPTPNNTPTDNGKGMIQSNVDLNVSANGQISFNQGNQDSFSIVGITIEDIKVENGNLEIKVVDTNLSQNFIVTQSDGTSLPTGLSFNPKTGTISGIIPDNLEKLEISIKAINPDGTTKVLNLKLDLKQLKQKTQAEAESFIGLKEQIALENQKNDGYGSYLTKLFA